MYLVYTFVEKRTQKIIYVGSTARPSERIKEHLAAIKGVKPQANIHRYLNSNNLTLYKDVEVRWVDSFDTLLDARLEEEHIYYKHIDTVLNERPGEDRKGNYNPRSRLVKCLEDGKEFQSVVSCSKYYNIPRTTISSNLSGHRKCAKTKDGRELHFQYITVLNV